MWELRVNNGDGWGRLQTSDSYEELKRAISLWHVNYHQFHNAEFAIVEAKQD